MSRPVGLLGGTSPLGSQTLCLLRQNGMPVVAFSRNPPQSTLGVEWRSFDSELNEPCLTDALKPIDWISCLPIWALAEHLPRLLPSGARRIVALSSTSVLTKRDSCCREERQLVARLMAGEQALQRWSAMTGTEWVVLRPTLIYGLGKDKNIALIAHVVRKLRFFPTAGQALGLRQPVHSRDVAAACWSALQVSEAGSRIYTLSGGETISYRAMVERIFTALGRRPRILTLPLGLFQAFAVLTRFLPKQFRWNAAMAERMNQDLVFDHSEAARELGFQPRGFQLSSEDLPL